jgi:hypothetical protein
MRLRLPSGMWCGGSGAAVLTHPFPPSPLRTRACVTVFPVDA